MTMTKNRILIGLGAFVGLLLIIVLGRALMVSRPDVPAPAAKIDVNANMVAQHLASAIRFQSVSYGGSAHEPEKFAALEAMRSWLEQTYPNFHRVAKRDVMDHTLLFTWKGKNAKLAPVLLMAHMDVVPVVPGTERDWLHQPFSGDIDAGFVWGRGAIDDKGSLITILEAAEKLAASGFTPERTIMFAFGQDEEVGGAKGNGVVAKALAARGVHFAWVLDEGGAILDEPLPGMRSATAVVAVAEKGYLSIELVAHAPKELGSESISKLNLMILHR